MSDLKNTSVYTLKLKGYDGGLTTKFKIWYSQADLYRRENSKTGGVQHPFAFMSGIEL